MSSNLSAEADATYYIRLIFQFFACCFEAILTLFIEIIQKLYSLSKRKKLYIKKTYFPKKIKTSITNRQTKHKSQRRHGVTQEIDANHEEHVFESQSLLSSNVAQTTQTTQNKTTTISSILPPSIITHKTLTPDPENVKLSTLVVGGSFAGITVCQELSTSNQYNVVLVEPKDYFEYTPSILRGMTYTPHLKKIIRPLHKFTCFDHVRAYAIDVTEVKIQQHDSTVTTFTPTEHYENEDESGITIDTSTVSTENPWLSKTHASIVQLALVNVDGFMIQDEPMVIEYLDRIRPVFEQQGMFITRTCPFQKDHGKLTRFSEDNEENNAKIHESYNYSIFVWCDIAILATGSRYTTPVKPVYLSLSQSALDAVAGKREVITAAEASVSSSPDQVKDVDSTESIDAHTPTKSRIFDVKNGPFSQISRLQSLQSFSQVLSIYNTLYSKRQQQQRPMTPSSPTSSVKSASIDIYGAGMVGVELAAEIHHFYPKIPVSLYCRDTSVLARFDPYLQDSCSNFLANPTQSGPSNVKIVYNSTGTTVEPSHDNAVLRRSQLYADMKSYYYKYKHAHEKYTRGNNGSKSKVNTTVNTKDQHNDHGYDVEADLANLKSMDFSCIGVDPCSMPIYTVTITPSQILAMKSMDTANLNAYPTECSINNSTIPQRELLHNGKGYFHVTDTFQVFVNEKNHENHENAENTHVFERIFSIGDVSKHRTNLIKMAYIAEVEGHALSHILHQMYQYNTYSLSTSRSPCSSPKTLLKAVFSDLRKIGNKILQICQIPVHSAMVYPECSFGNCDPPLLCSVSLGPKDGVLIFNSIMIPGFMAYFAKAFIERTKVGAMEEEILCELLWCLGDSVVTAMNKVYRFVETK